MRAPGLFLAMVATNTMSKNQDSNDMSEHEENIALQSKWTQEQCR